MKFYNAYLVFIFLILACSCSSLRLERGERSPEVYRVLWTKAFDPGYDSGNLPLSFNSPLLHKGFLFAGTPTGDMVAYRSADGQEMWRQKESAAISNAPFVYENLLIYGTVGGEIVARNFQTGALVYKEDLGESVESSLCEDGGKGFVQLRTHTLVSFDLLTGKILWTYKRTISQSTTVHQVGTPVVVSGKVLVGFADGYLVAFNRDEGKLLWETRLAEGTKFVDINMAPLPKENLIYAGSLSGPLSVLNASTGELIHKYSFQVAKTPLLIGDLLLVGTTQGDVHLINSLGEVKATHALHSPIFSIKKVGMMVALATRDGRVVFLNETLKEQKTLFLGHAYSLVFGDFSVDQDKMAFLSSRNRLYLLQLF